MKSVDRRFSDFIICHGCLGPFCKDDDCESSFPRPADGVDRCGGDVPLDAKACVECGMEWRPMSPLTDDEDDKSSD